MSGLQLCIQGEFPGIVSGGAFGKNVSFVSFEMNDDYVTENLIMSTVTFGTVTTSDGSRYSIIFKSKPQNLEIIESRKINEQFHNEILMYEMAIPFLLACHESAAKLANPFRLSLPRYYYGRNECGEFVEKDLIVLENVCASGYRMCDERVFLDYDHLLVAIQALAKFHALSYTAKHRDPAGFRNICAGVRDVVWHADGRLSAGKHFRKLGKRAADRLRAAERDSWDAERLRGFDELIAGGNGSLRRALRPREPLSVLCHGDFNRNNVMFRYGADGRPVDAMPVDFGTVRYGSPALDLSYFLYTNADRPLRDAHWDRLLDAYCAALAAAVPSGGGGVRVPDRDDVHAEMRASGAFGVASVLCFLPVLLHDQQADVSRVLAECAGDVTGASLLMGGDAATERVADVVRHFVDAGYDVNVSQRDG